MVYEAKWDTLYTDNKANTLRAKILSKFTPRVTHNSNRKEIAKPVPVSIEKAPLAPPPLLPVKSKRRLTQSQNISKVTKR